MVGIFSILPIILRIDRTIKGMREMMVAAMQVHLTLKQSGRTTSSNGWLAGGDLAVPTMVFSWYGMNFRHTGAEWEYSYPVVVGGVWWVVCCCIGLKGPAGCKLN
jgi:magnesium transporter